MSYARNLARLARLGIHSFPDIDSLRNMQIYGAAPPAAVDLVSHAQGTGLGGGLFDWIAGSTAADDNGHVIQLANHVGSGRYHRRDPHTTKPENFGALGDGVRDDWAEVTAAQEVDGMEVIYSSMYGVSKPVKLNGSKFHRGLHSPKADVKGVNAGLVAVGAFPATVALSDVAACPAPLCYVEGADLAHVYGDQRANLFHLALDCAYNAPGGLIVAATAQSLMTRVEVRRHNAFGVCFAGTQNAQVDKMFIGDGMGHSLIVCNGAANNIFISWNCSGFSENGIRMDSMPDYPNGVSKRFGYSGARNNKFYGGLIERVYGGSSKALFHLAVAKDNIFDSMNPYCSDKITGPACGVIVEAASVHNYFNKMHFQADGRGVQTPVAVLDEGDSNSYVDCRFGIFGKAGGGDMDALIEAHNRTVVRGLSYSNVDATKYVKWAGGGSYSQITYEPKDAVSNALPDMSKIDAFVTYAVASDGPAYYDNTNDRWLPLLHKGTYTKPDGATTVAIPFGIAVLNCNDSAPCTVTEITDGVVGQILHIIFQKTNTTLQDSAGGVDKMNFKTPGDYTPTGLRSTVTLFKTSTTWRQIGDS